MQVMTIVYSGGRLTALFPTMVDWQCDTMNSICVAAEGKLFAFIQHVGMTATSLYIFPSPMPSMPNKELSASMGQPRRRRHISFATLHVLHSHTRRAEHPA